MRWKNLKLGRKFFISFGLIIILQLIVVIGAIKGIGLIVGNAEKVIEGDKLRADIEHMHLKHLNWSLEVNKLFTDDSVTELNVQTDPNECSFGIWYYGEGRKHAEILAPELKDLFDKIEEPHKHLHESAIKIDEVFYQADVALGAKLRDIKTDHLMWAHSIKDALLNKETALNVQKDPQKCKFGVWLNSDEVIQMRKNDPELDILMASIIEPHNNLHTSAVQIENYLARGNFNAAYNYFNNNTKKYALATLNLIDDVIAWNDKNLQGMQEAHAIYNNETMVYSKQVGDLFDEIVEKSKDYILTEDAMFQEANNTRVGVSVFGLIAIIIAIIFALVITRGIVNPVKQGVDFATAISKGNLTVTIDVDQEDEIGKLVQAFQLMISKLKDIIANIIVGADNIASASQQMSSTAQQISQGASEQASSAEEVSSSMEEMAANIQQNTDNAQQTEKIAINASEGVNMGSASTDISVNAMKKIAEKISIVNDIAFQTNILALNAAVEAARAGEHGKGFAVVAAEVRKLAERSKIAADEISRLSSEGVQVSEEAGSQLSEIVPEIEKTAKLVQEIAASSMEQNSGADQVNSAIQQLNQVTQQNAASSEEMATGAEELSSQAEQLQDIISYFKVDTMKTNIMKNKPVAKKQEIKINENELVKNIEEKGISIRLDDVSDNQYEKF